MNSGGVVGEPPSHAAAPAARITRDNSLTILILIFNPLRHPEQVDVEHQPGVAWDVDVAGRSVSERGRNHQSPRAADAHARHPFDPSLNNLSLLQNDREWLAGA